MPGENGPSSLVVDETPLTRHVADQLKQNIEQAAAKLAYMVEDLKGLPMPDPDHLAIVSDNLSPLAADGQPTDKILFPLAEVHYKNASHSERLWFWLRGSKVIECMPRGTFRIRPMAARSRIILIPDVPGGTFGQQIAYILVLRATYSNSWVDLTKIFNRIWNDTDWVLGELDSQHPRNWKKWQGIRPYPEVSKDEFRNLWRHQTIYKKDADSIRAALENLRSRTDFHCRFPSLEGTIVAFDVPFGHLIKLIEGAAEVVEVKLITTGESEKEGARDIEDGAQEAKSGQLGINKGGIQFREMTKLDSNTHDADVEPKETEDGQPSINDTDSEPTIQGDTEPSSHSTDTDTVDAIDVEQGSQNADTGSKKATSTDPDARDMFPRSGQEEDSGPFTHATDVDYAQVEYAPLAMHRTGGDCARMEFMPPLPLDSDADFPQVRGMRIGNFVLDNSDYD